MTSEADLRLEVERLTSALEQASAEKVQSAQYGLALLEDKEQLEIRCTELEALYDNTRHELGITQEALAKFHNSQMESAQAGIEHEEHLLHESAARESSLNTQVINMEIDLKQTKMENERLKSEKERVELELNDFLQSKEVSTHEVKEMKTELRDFKHRETRLLTDYAELEEENIMLQKQISNLRSSQVEFEGSKHEIRHLQEDVELLQQQVEELSSLKKIAEKQLEEALESLQNEREQRYILKKELDSRMNSENMYQLGNLAISIQGAIDGEEATDVEGDSEILAKDDDNESGPPSDLFSEIHGGEMKKLEKKVESAENDKIIMSKTLADTKTALDKARNEIKNYQANIVGLSGHLAALQQLQEEHRKQTEVLDNSAEAKKRLELGDNEIQKMQEQLKELESLDPSVDAITKLKSEIVSLRKDILAAEQKSAELGQDLRILEKLSSDSVRALGDTQSEMNLVQSELSKIYEHVCKTNHQTPSRLMLMRTGGKGEGGKDRPSPKRTQSSSELLLGKLRSSSSRNQFKDVDLSSADPGTVKSNIESVKDQIKYLKDAIDKYIEMTKSKELAGANAGSKDGELEADLRESQEQVVKLKSLLSTKREQIATLRTVLKANKQTAEVALANLKSKYDNEKMVVSETMTKLRNELRLLKEDAATFSSLRAMFAARCEEYATQVEELQRSLSSNEDEKKTLNQLLRMAIQQKLVLTQRLEDVEMASEMRNTPKRFSARGRSSRGGGGKGGAGYNHFQSGGR